MKNATHKEKMETMFFWFWLCLVLISIYLIYIIEKGREFNFGVYMTLTILLFLIIINLIEATNERNKLIRERRNEVINIYKKYWFKSPNYNELPTYVGIEEIWFQNFKKCLHNKLEEWKK